MRHTHKTTGNNSKDGECLPLYGPDSMMPSVVEAKLLEVTQDSERFRAPGPPGYESYDKIHTGIILTGLMVTCSGSMCTLCICIGC